MLWQTGAYLTGLASWSRESRGFSWESESEWKKIMLARVESRSEFILCILFAGPSRNRRIKKKSVNYFDLFSLQKMRIERKPQ